MSLPCLYRSYDMVCPMKTAWDLHRALPEADFILVDDNGHSAMEPGISAELVKAADRVRDMLVWKSLALNLSASQHWSP